MTGVVDVGEGSWAFTFRGCFVENKSFVASNAFFGLIVPSVAGSRAISAVSRGRGIEGDMAFTFIGSAVPGAVVDASHTSPGS